MIRKHAVIVAMVGALAVMAASIAIGQGENKAVVKPKGDIVWKDMGVPGVSAACVSGDMTKGPCRFYLKYGKGFAAPAHHHTPDHRGTVVSGVLALKTDDTTYTLPAGSYFELYNMKVHAAAVVGDEDCVMFIEADGPWDAVMEK